MQYTNLYGSNSLSTECTPFLRPNNQEALIYSQKPFEYSVVSEHLRDATNPSFSQKPPKGDTSVSFYQGNPFTVLPSTVVSETVFNPDLAISGLEETYCSKSGYPGPFGDLYTGKINQPVYSPGNQTIYSTANSTLESIAIEPFYRVILT